MLWMSVSWRYSSCFPGNRNPLTPKSASHSYQEVQPVRMDSGGLTATVSWMHPAVLALQRSSVQRFRSLQRCDRQRKAPVGLGANVFRAQCSWSRRRLRQTCSKAAIKTPIRPRRHCLTTQLSVVQKGLSSLQPFGVVLQVPSAALSHAWTAQPVEPPAEQLLLLSTGTWTHTHTVFARVVRAAAAEVAITAIDGGFHATAIAGSVDEGVHYTLQKVASARQRVAAGHRLLCKRCNRDTTRCCRPS